MKKGFLTVVMVLMLLLGALAACGNGGTVGTGGDGGGGGGGRSDNGGGRPTTGVDYIGTVKQLAPFVDLDIYLTYEQAFNRFMTSVNWTARPQDGGIAFVDVSGNLADIGGTAIDLTVTIRLTPIEGREDFYMIEPILIEMNGRLFGMEAADYLVTDFFSTYYWGFNSVAEYYASYGLTSIFDYIRQNFN